MRASTLQRLGLPILIFAATRIDPVSGATLDVIEAGDEPRVVSFPGSDDVWLANQEEGTVLVVRADS